MLKIKFSIAITCIFTAAPASSGPGLPHPWVEARNEANEVFYHNTVTDEVCGGSILTCNRGHKAHIDAINAFISTIRTRVCTHTCVLVSRVSMHTYTIIFLIFVRHHCNTQTSWTPPAAVNYNNAPPAYDMTAIGPSHV